MLPNPSIVIKGQTCRFEKFPIVMAVSPQGELLLVNPNDDQEWLTVGATTPGEIRFPYALLYKTLKAANNNAARLKEVIAEKENQAIKGTTPIDGSDCPCRTVNLIMAVMENDAVVITDSRGANDWVHVGVFNRTSPDQRLPQLYDVLKHSTEERDDLKSSLSYANRKIAELQNDKDHLTKARSNAEQAVIALTYENTALKAKVEELHKALSQYRSAGPLDYQIGEAIATPTHFTKSPNILKEDCDTDNAGPISAFSPGPVRGADKTTGCVDEQGYTSETEAYRPLRAMHIDSTNQPDTQSTVVYASGSGPIHIFTQRGGAIDQALIALALKDVLRDHGDEQRKAREETAKRIVETFTKSGKTQA